MQSMRSLNFFSPVRKALRDSAFRLKMDRFRERKKEQREKNPSSVNVASDLSTKFSNEEILRKNVRVKRMVSRPTAVMPRRHLLFIKNGTVPLSLEDLSVPAPSVFDESKIPNLKVLFSEKVKKNNMNDESWLFRKSPKKGVRVVEWKKVQDLTPPEENKKISSISSVLDLNMERPSASKTSPEILTKTILGPQEGVLSQEKSLTSTAANLIAVLREKAVSYASTGIQPDLLERVRSAIGLERRSRLDELTNCPYDSVSSIISAGKASPANFNLLIRVLGHRKRITEAFAVHDSMVQLGFETDHETYASLIIAAGSDAALARKAYLKMREMLIPASEKFYGCLIKAHVMGGDLEAGFALLEKMENESLIPTGPVIYTTLLDGLVRQGKTELAWDRFRNWRTWKSVVPDAVMFSVMIKACIRNQECERALSVLEDLRASGEFPTDVTYTHLMECMSGRSDFAQKTFEFHSQMQLEGFALNKVAARSLVRACASLGDLNLLRKVIRDISEAGLAMSGSMYADAIRTIATSMRTSNLVTDFEKGANLKLAWHIVHDMRTNKGIALTASILNAVMQVYAASGSKEQTIAVLDQFEKFQVAPNAESYEILFEGFEDDDVGRFFALFDFCGKKNIALSERIIHRALDMAIQSRSSKRTVSVLEAMLERRIRPLPAAAEKLAVVGRKIIQIHQVVGKMVAQQRDETHEKTERENALIALDIEEHRTRIAHSYGTTDREFVTNENAARQIFWSKQQRRKSPRLCKKDHKELKKKGGRLHALRIDKPRPNLLAN